MLLALCEYGRPPARPRVAAYALPRFSCALYAQEIIMVKKLVLAAGLVLSLGSAAYADTPIGAGVTGSGGTGPNKSDPNTGVPPSGDTRVQRPEGSEPISGNAKAEASITTQDTPRATHPSGPEGKGATGAAGAGGKVRGGAGATAEPGKY
jgi:hypothetical protein